MSTPQLVPLTPSVNFNTISFSSYPLPSLEVQQTVSTLATEKTYNRFCEIENF
jgi:hypothetical protein